jgi:hypothetical protein
MYLVLKQPLFLRGNTLKQRRHLITMAVVFAVLALVVGLPSLLSRPMVQVSLMELVEPRLKGRVQLQSCSISWLQGISWTGVRYRDPRHHLEVHLPKVHTDKGLLTLALAPQYLGALTLEQPTLIFLASSGHDVAAAGPSLSEPRESGSSGQQAVSWWERWRLQLHLQGGRIVADQGAGASERVLARDVGLAAALDQGSITYRLHFRSEQAGGHFRAQGFVNLPNPGQPFFSSLISQSTLDIEQLELEPLLTLAATRMAGIPRGKGVLNAACRLSSAGGEHLDVEGQATLHEVELTGGVLGEDHPALDEFNFRFQASRRPAEGWQLTALEVQSQPLSFSARGVVDRKRADFNGNGMLDLAQLASQLPQLLAIHGKTTVHQGRLHLGLQATGPLESLRLKADCTTDRLVITHDDRPYSWSTPLVVQIAATLVGRGIGSAELEVRAPFLTMTGEGTREDFSLRTTADLAPLFEELGKIFSLGLRAGGRLDFTLTTRSQADKIRIATRMNIDGFLLSRNQQLLIPASPLSLEVEAVGEPWFTFENDLHALRINATGWPGTIFLDADNLQAGDQDTAAARNCRIRSRLDVERLTAIRQFFSEQPMGVRTEGTIELEALGRWRRQHAEIDRLRGSITDFVLLDDLTPVFQEAQVDVGLDGGPLSRGLLAVGELVVVEAGRDIPPPEPAFCRIDLKQSALVIRNLRLRSDRGVLVGYWRGQPQPDQPAQPSLELQGLGDLASLTAWAGKRGWLAPGLSLGGEAQVVLTRRILPESGLGETDLKADIQDFTVVKGTTPLMTDPRVHLALGLSPKRGDKGGVGITDLTLRTSRFTIAGTGVAHMDEHPLRIEVQGDVQPTAAALASLAAEFLPGKLNVRSAVQGSVLVSAPLRLPVDLQRITLAGRFAVQSLEYRGVPVQDVTFVPELDRDQLRLPITGRIAGGQVALQPQWNWSKGPGLLTLPPESQVLLEVPVDQALTTGLLHLLPPLGCLVQASGTISLQSRRFSLPMARRSGQADFAVVIDLHSARPKAVHALQDILALAGLAGQPLRFQERELICEGWAGSITCAPLRLAAGERELTITGSMQRNGTLAYRIQLPVTEELTRAAGVSVYGRFTVNAEVSGTRAAPLFDRGAFLDGLAAQLVADLPRPWAEKSRTPKPVDPAPVPAPTN